MKSVVTVENNKMFYKGIGYKDSDIKEVFKELSKNIGFVILGEELRIRSYDILEGIKDINKYIEELILRDFIKDPDCLFHYEISKVDKEVILYGIRGGKIIEKASRAAGNISVIPIQFLLKEYIYKKNKSYKNYISIVRIKDLYYINFVKNNQIRETVVCSGINEVENKLIDLHGENIKIILDKGLMYEFKDFDRYKFEVLNIGDNIL